MIQTSLRFSYGRGVARVPVSVPRAGLEPVPFRSSREIVAAVSPLYLAALVPASMLLLVSFVVVGSRTPPAPSPLVIAPYRSFPTPIEATVDVPETPAKSHERLAQQPERSATEIASAPPASKIDTPFEIEIDALEPARQAAAPKPSVPLAARRVDTQFGKRERVAQLEPTTGETLAFALSSAPRAATNTAALPAVSLAGPAVRPYLDGVASDAPSAELLTGPKGGGAVRSQIFQQAASGNAGVGFQPLPRPSFGSSESLDGVPLESLAACRSRAREDALKQQVMREVASGMDCQGRGGHYRFLETKNLNAFSMGVESDPGRTLGNRCEELLRAKACVEDQRSGRVQP